MRLTTPIATGHPGGNLSGWMDTCAYICAGAGYLVAVLTEPHLALPGFALLTAGTVVWLLLYRRLAVGEICKDIEVFAIVAGLIGATAIALLGAWAGVGYDWLLPMATLGVTASIYSLAVVAWLGGVIWLIASLVMLWLMRGQGWVAFTNTEVQLVPAFVFVLAFSVVLRYHVQQRLHAEALVVQLEEAQQQLRAHASEVEELAVARERNRMAREIHDTLGHYLTILAVQLETALKLEERGDARLRDELVEARRAATECLAEVRRSVAALRPADPTAHSFADALRRLVAEFEATLPQTEITLDIEGPVQELAAELRVALYRCAQESLTNIRKHAYATKVLLRVRVDERQAELTVLDNGDGAQSSVDGHEPGFGLLGMSERIALLGGVASARPQPGRGWRVEVHVPLPATMPEECAPVSPSEVVATPSPSPSTLASVAVEG
jgi:signal transduction histidine kinase